MAKPLKGSVDERILADGTKAYYVAIRRKNVLIGKESEGWNRGKVDALLRDKLVPLAILNRPDQPWWRAIPGAEPAGPRPGHVPNTQEAFSDYLHALKSKYSNPNSLNAYVSPVKKHLGPYFARPPRPLDTITGTDVGSFIQDKRSERAVLQDLPDTLAELDSATLSDPHALRAQLDDQEWELLMLYGQRGGRAAALDADATGRFSLSSRGLSDNEINRCLSRLRSVLRMVNARNALTLPDPTFDMFLPNVTPARDWLRPHQMVAVFDAAAELDAGVVIERETFKAVRGRRLDKERNVISEGRVVEISGHAMRSRYAELGRLEIVTTLGLAGPRVSELAHAIWEDMHEHAHIWRIPDAKTHAGERDLRLHSLVAGAIAARRARLDPKPKDPVYATAAGTPRDRNNIRNRILAGVLARARELLAERGQLPMPDRITPHAFRRSYLTYLAWAGVPQRRAMSQAGQKDAKVVLEVYQQDFPDDPVAERLVKEWVQFRS